MSEALFGLGQLPFWTEREIMVRDQATQTISHVLQHALQRLNSAWTFHRVEGPLLTPRRHISPAYTADDIFMLDAKLGEDDAALRAETTATSYLYADHLLKTTRLKPPICVWQAGKSFRREALDGARASTLRFNEFYQLEFQCIYAEGTTADYRGTAEAAVSHAIRLITNSTEVRMVASDRLPAYATETRDVEVPWAPYSGKTAADENFAWKEMASISTRTDFPQPTNPQQRRLLVLEIAVGLDRLVSVEGANYKRAQFEMAAA